MTIAVVCGAAVLHPYGKKSPSEDRPLRSDVEEGLVKVGDDVFHVFDAYA